MDVFSLREQLIGDYARYIQSFIRINDPRISEHVDQELRDGLLWPDPLIQLNPNFEPGAWIDELVGDGILHPGCSQIFRLKEPDGASKPLRLHRHQTDAVDAARSGDNYVLTTGTGSGKSLAYIVPIVDFVLRQGSGKGIRAIVVYPMNALANSQHNELEKFLCRGLPLGQPPVTFRRYTGQEKDEERDEILANPPDILLTNYVMLELMLTQPRERKIVSAAHHALRFLVLDELHTYRGRQGADVSLLVRRVREVAESSHLQCVGTSATLAEAGTLAAQQTKIAAIAGRIFGAPVKPAHVIGETLRRATRNQALDDPAFLAELTRRVSDPACQPPTAYEAFLTDPLSIWIESTFGLTLEPETGRLRRAKPISITGAAGAAGKLAEATGVPESQCRSAIQQALLAGYHVQHPETGFPVFAFRLHQFISRGDTVYASLEAPEERYITTQGQQYVPGDRSRILLPVAFCRECGQEYYTVYRHIDAKTKHITYQPREVYDQSGEESATTGFLYPNFDYPWPEDAQEITKRLPEDWLEVYKGAQRIKSSYRTKQPFRVQVNTLGHEAAAGAVYHFLRSPFPLCLNCGVSYGGHVRSDYGKLASLTSEGRSTATTVLSLSLIRALRADTDLVPEARKLLSFTDNRQDASLQAGHFNDFVEVALLRGGLFRAVQAAGEQGMTHEVLAQCLFEALNLPMALYASDPTVEFQAKRETQRALREVMAYRVYHDRRRGSRVTSPNLEQCGLLAIEYGSLDELCAAEQYWADLHPALADATPATRYTVAKVLLDHLRRELAIRVNYLDPVYQESLQQLSSQRLCDPWAIDDGEVMVHAFTAFPRAHSRPTAGKHLRLGTWGFRALPPPRGNLAHMPRRSSRSTNPSW